MVTLITYSFLIALVLAFVLIRRAREHTKHYADSMPQRFHVGDTPRLGGVAIMVGMSAGWMFGPVASLLSGDIRLHLAWAQVWPWLVALMPAVVGGAMEDATQRVSAKYRLGMTGLSALIAWWLLDLSIGRFGIPVVDSWLVMAPWLGAVLAVTAISGLPHAFNMIDGYNGLAGIVAVMICLALAHVSLQVGDRELAAIVLCTAAATAGFLIWNYPFGKIFAGDGGAYLWGVVTAIASILLVQRHPTVSPWFPMLVLMYPVWEAVFSIYRKIARGGSPGAADALHFHQLIHRRIVRNVLHDDDARQMLMRNNRTSPYLWVIAALTTLPATLFWTNTPVLIGLCVLFIVTYVVAYVLIVRFKVPRWLLKRRLTRDAL
jgi:UDP-GlcNAc:undecaprenyl-phosphate/decaprenyl-phosphate GlcNAc-1-phosphate transferase